MVGAGGLGGLAGLLDHPVATAHVDHVLDRGVDVCGRGRDDESLAGGAHRLVFGDRQRDPLRAALVVALADEIPSPRAMLAVVERSLGELLDPFVDATEERLILPLPPVPFHRLRVSHAAALGRSTEGGSACHTPAMSGPAKPSGVIAPALARAASGCETAVARHLAGRKRQPGLHFSRPVTLAIALLGEYGERTALSEEDIELLGSACAEAAAACRSQPPDEPLLVAAELFADVARASATALGTPAPEPDPPEWRRFLFPDADLEVARDSGSWRVRVGTKETERKLLDDALAELLSLSNHRLGELTVQILLWHNGPPPP
jgi:hypothetical protein